MNDNLDALGQIRQIQSAEDAFQCEREAYERLHNSYELLRKALERIAYSSHCIYEDNPSQYAIGVADGHRCAANMAKEALKNNEPN